jgi:cobalt/nickel transport system permease protein
MISEAFVSKESLINKLDPRTRLISALVLALIIAVSAGFTTIVTAFVLSLIFISISGLNLQAVFKRVFIVNLFILLFWVILPFTFKAADTAMFRIGSFTISQEGVLLAARITLKSNAILLFFIALVAALPLGLLGHAMNRLHVPKKMVQLLLLTYRYLFVIEQEYQRLLTAAKVRCFHSKTKMHTYKTYAFLVGMLFVRASEQAERVHQAMRCRGFSGTFFSLHTFSFCRIDAVWAMVMTVLVIVLEIMEWTNIIQ